MKSSVRRALAFLAAALAGSLAWLAFGTPPGSVAPPQTTDVRWSLPGGDAQELQGPDKVWEERAPWRTTAAPAVEVPPPPPPYLPVGVVGTGPAAQAIFVAAGSPEVRVKPGDSLPDGGRVTRVSPFRVAWKDAKGAEHEQQLFADPLPTQNTNP